MKPPPIDPGQMPLFPPPRARAVPPPPPPKRPLLDGSHEPTAAERDAVLLVPPGVDPGDGSGESVRDRVACELAARDAVAKRLRDERNKLRAEIVALRGHVEHDLEIAPYTSPSGKTMFRCTRPGCGWDGPAPVGAYHDGGCVVARAREFLGFRSPVSEADLAQFHREWTAMGALAPVDDVPRYLRVAIANATRALATGDDAALGTVNETIQPLIDAAMARIRKSQGASS